MSVLMVHPRLDSLLVTRGDGKLSLDRRVNRVIGEVQEERLAFGVVQDFEGFAGQPVGEIFSRLAAFQMRHVAKAVEGLAVPPVGIEERLRRSPERAADVVVEPLRLRVEGGGSEMPFTNMRGEVTRIVKHFGDRHFLMRKTADGNRRDYLAIERRPLRRFVPDGHV